MIIKNWALAIGLLVVGSLEAAESPQKPLKPHAPATADEEPEEDPTFSYLVNSKEPHEVALMNHGMVSFEHNLRLIEKAKKSIDFESFLIHEGQSMRTFLQLLIKKAREGVKVRFLLDYTVTAKMNPYLQHVLQKNGIEVKYFNKKLNLLTGHSNHRKMLVIDGQEVVVGGRNIGDEYTEISKKFNHLDRDIWVKGPLVEPMAKSFELFWNSPQAQPLVLKDKKIAKEIHKGEKSKFDGVLNVEEETDQDREFRKKLSAFYDEQDSGPFAIVPKICNDTTFVTDLPGPNPEKDHKVGDEIYRRMGQVKKSFYMDTPVFINSRKNAAALQSLIDRGVQTKVYMSGLKAADNPLVGILNDDILKWIDKPGVEVYVHSAEAVQDRPFLDEKIKGYKFAMHSKSAVFDDDSIMVSSYNFDPRSEFIDSQLAVFCDGNKELAAQLRADMDGRLAASYKLTPKKGKEFFKGVTFKKKMSYRIFGPALRLFFENQI